MSIEALDKKFSDDVASATVTRDEYRVLKRQIDTLYELVGRYNGYVKANKVYHGAGVDNIASQILKGSN